MKSKKKLIAYTLLTALCTAGVSGEQLNVSAAENVVISENFEMYNSGQQPADFICSYYKGTVKTVRRNGEMCLFVGNAYDGHYTSVERLFNPLSNTVVDVSFRFMQSGTISDENVLISLRNDSENIVQIVTRGGSVFCNDTLILDEYTSDKWYSVELSVNLITKTVTAEADGVRTENIVANNILECNNIQCSTMYSPGFYLDDIVVKENHKGNTMVIDGDSLVAIPQYGENLYTYTAGIFDEDDNPVYGHEFIWSIENDVTGIKLLSGSSSEDITLVVENGVESTGIVRLKASCKENPDLYVYKTITVEKQQAETMKIEGSPRVTYNSENFSYAAVAYDASGKEINRVDCIWSLGDDAPDYVSVDPESGKVSLSSEPLEDSIFTLRAQVKDSEVVAEKKIVAQNLKRYAQDSWRMKVLQSAVDNLIEYSSDPYSDSPLLAWGIDLRTGRPVEWINSVGGEGAAISNLAFDTSLYMTFDALSNLTDDSKYKDRVDEIYSWYIENALADNMLGYWGGHTFIDLKTLKPYHAVPNPLTHELKSAYLYMAPFYRLNNETGYNIGKHIWLGHVTNWKTLTSNRHAYYTGKHNEANWDNLSVFSEDYKMILSRSEQPFKAMACDLVHIAGNMYKHTGDTTALKWGMRMLNCYYKLRNEETGIVPSVYTTARDAEGVRDPLLTIEPLGAWWTNPNLGVLETSVHYGDRFFNQFAEDLVEQGFYDSSVLEKGNYTLTEGYYIKNLPSEYALSDLAFVDIIGADTEDGKYIQQMLAEYIAGYIKYAWKEGTGEFKHIMADGTDISEFIPNRNGYYGNYYNRGLKLGTYKPDDTFMLMLCSVYNMAVQREDLKDEAEIMWKAIDYFAENVYGFGKLGDEYIGDSAMKLSTTTENASPYSVICAVNLYYSSGKTEFLDLARRLAANMINSHYLYGVFCDNTSTGTGPGKYYNLRLGGHTSSYYYALEYLEAAIRGDKGLIPEGYVPFDGYYQDNYVYENEKVYREMDSTLWNMTDKNVLVDKICFNEKEIVLKVGEKRKLKYEIFPSDATNKAVSLWIENTKVAGVDSSEQTVSAFCRGETELICVSEDFNVTEKIKIIVE